MRGRTLSPWKGARVAVVGLARSGVAACRFLRKREAIVVGTDLRTAEQLGSAVSDLVASGVDLSLGDYPDLAAFDALVLSPGVDPSQEAIRRARDAGVTILPELELGAREVKGLMVCITGTKGKSTTTMSLHAMLRDGGLDARAVGNIGEPITAHVDGSDERSIFVVEASSFQLEITTALRPHYAVFLNLFPDHLDRHPTFEAYAAAKARIFSNQTARDTAVVNGEEPAVVDLARQTRAQVIPFRPRTPPSPQTPSPVAYLHDGNAFIKERDDLELFRSADVRIPGAAIRGNFLAAAATAHRMGVKADSIRNAVRDFRGVPHTFERIGELGGVVFFNDSKATTPESVKVALNSFDAPVIAIMGGRLKAGSFSSLREAAARHTKAIYAIGESRELIIDALSSVCPVTAAETLEEAVHSAHRIAKPGDTILLSPGCSSFDMFRDYAERGDVFRRVFADLHLRGAA